MGWGCGEGMQKKASGTDHQAQGMPVKRLCRTFCRTLFSICLMLRISGSFFPSHLVHFVRVFLHRLPTVCRYFSCIFVACMLHTALVPCLTTRTMGPLKHHPWSLTRMARESASPEKAWSAPTFPAARKSVNRPTSGSRRDRDMGTTAQGKSGTKCPPCSPITPGTEV